MDELLHAFASYRFLQLALLTGLLASIACGIVGTYVVVRRISFLAGGIAHAVLGGMGAALFFGQDPFIGALLTALGAALLVGWISMRWKADEDTLISATWSAGMASGILFIAATPGYNVDLMSYLFGNILLVSERDVAWTAALDLVLIVIVALFHKTFELVVFDDEFARLRGVPVSLFYFLLLGTVAITVVLLIQLVGLILVIALLTLPAAIGRHYLHTLTPVMLFATLAGGLFTSSGIALAYVSDMPAGAIIILLTVFAFLLSTAVHRQIMRRRKLQLRPARSTHTRQQP